MQQNQGALGQQQNLDKIMQGALVQPRNLVRTRKHWGSQTTLVEQNQGPLGLAGIPCRAKQIWNSRELEKLGRTGTARKTQATLGSARTARKTSVELGRAGTPRKTSEEHGSTGRAKETQVELWDRKGSLGKTREHRESQGSLGITREPVGLFSWRNPRQNCGTLGQPGKPRQN